jgi:hypothetical protein
MRRLTAALLVVALLPVGGCGGDTDAAAVSSSQATTISLPVIDGAALAERGSYEVGRARREIVDSDRDGRRIGVTALYPAVADVQLTDDAAPDDSGAPYPVVLGDWAIVDVVGTHLASHGFVFLSVDEPDEAGPVEKSIDVPLDLIAALDDVESGVGHPLAGIADPSRAGVIGYSFGCTITLALSGARYDPGFRDTVCEAKPERWSEEWWEGVCLDDPEDWVAVTERAEALGLPEPDGRWRALGDSRIRAVMPMGPQGFETYGPNGLADASAAALFIAAGSDTENDYDPATTDLYENYPGAELITFVGAGHMMIFSADAVSQIRRFAVALFGLHLQGDERYARFLTREFVEEEAPGLGEAHAFETLIWGVVED